MKWAGLPLRKTLQSNFLQSKKIQMYIPCQFMDFSSLESQASAVQRFCCPCSTPRRHSGSRRQSSNSKHDEIEDPELVFSRHRAAVIASHRFLTNHAGIWNLQNLAPPLPQLAPPPLPPRRLSSFFPPMPPMSPTRGGSENNGPQNDSDEPQRAVSRKGQSRVTPPAKAAPLLTASTSRSPLPANTFHRQFATSIACPYLSPIDVAATSWEWDFGNDDTLRTHTACVSSPSDQESGATDRVNIWGDPPVVKKGLLMQQREKMWSRWKERYFILTRDYLHCFRRLRNVYRFHITLSAMGQFIYKLRLANVEEIRWESRRNSSRIALAVTHEATILLRSSDNNTEALHHWYTLLQECVCMSKIRRQALRCFNISSEEDTQSRTNPSRINSNTDYFRTNTDSNSNSSYTVATSATSGSSQADILEIYRRCGSLQRQNAGCILPNIKSPSGLYISSGHPPSERPHAQLKRLPLPVLDSESEIEDPEIHDILHGLPKRCSNPTREIEASSSSSQASEIRKGFKEKDSSTKSKSSTPPHFENIPITMRCASRVTLRDFVKAPWRSNSACLATSQQPLPTQRSSSPSPSLFMMRELRDSNLENSSRLSAFPVPSRRPPIPQRPVSSFSRPPPHGVFGGRKVLPTPWMKNPTLQIGKGAAFCRSNVIVCPSKLSSDVTYLRRM